MTPNARVIVVGGGVGGLVAAALLSHQGVRVTLLERAAALGGKLRQAEVDRQAIDVGPTVFTLRPPPDRRRHRRPRSRAGSASSKVRRHCRLTEFLHVSILADTCNVTQA